MNNKKNRNEYYLKYKKKNYKRVPLDIPINDYEKLKAHTEKTKESVNGFIKRAIKETIAHDTEK